MEISGGIFGILKLQMMEIVRALHRGRQEDEDCGVSSTRNWSLVLFQCNKLARMRGREVLHPDQHVHMHVPL